MNAEAVDTARRTKIMLKQSALKHCITTSRNNCDVMLANAWITIQPQQKNDIYPMSHRCSDKKQTNTQSWGSMVTTSGISNLTSLEDLAKLLLRRPASSPPPDKQPCVLMPTPTRTWHCLIGHQILAQDRVIACFCFFGNGWWLGWWWISSSSSSLFKCVCHLQIHWL